MITSNNNVPDYKSVKRTDDNSHRSSNDDRRPVNSPNPNQRDFREVMEDEDRKSKLGKSKKDRLTTALKTKDQVTDEEKNEEDPSLLDSPDASIEKINRRKPTLGQQSGQQESEKPLNDVHPLLANTKTAKLTKEEEESEKLLKDVHPLLANTKTAKLTKEEDAELALEEKTGVVAYPVEGKKESPFNIYKQLAKHSKPVSERDWETIAQAGSEGELTGLAASVKEEKTSVRNSDGEMDLAFINPFGVNSSSVVGVGISTGTIQQVSAADLQALIDKIVDGIYTLQKTGSTNTIITLKNIPLFADAQVVISSFDSAKKEFNLSFENLRPDAKLLVDANLNSLRSALEEQGFAAAVHIITTTTFIEHPVAASESKNDQRDKGGKEDQGGQQQKKRQQKEEQQ